MAARSEVLLVAVALGWLLLVLVLWQASGCGGNASPPKTAETNERTRLALVSAVDRSYAAAVAYCDAEAGVITGRRDSTRTLDEEAFAHLRKRCDAAFAVFERVRKSERQLPQLLDAVQALEELQQGHTPPLPDTAPFPALEATP